MQLHAATYVATGEIAHGAVYSCDYVADNGGELKGDPLRLSGVVSTWSCLSSFSPTPLFRLTRALYSNIIFGSMNIYASTCLYSYTYIDIYIYIFIYIYILMNIEVSCVKRETEKIYEYTDRPIAIV